MSTNERGERVSKKRLSLPVSGRKRGRKTAARDEFVDGVVFAAATLVAAFDQPTMAAHLLQCVGWKRGLPLDEKHLRRVRSDAASRLPKERRP